MSFWEGFASDLSWVLLAELAVGRIILARNPSLTGFVLVPTSLVRELGRSWAGWTGREGRDDCLRRPPVVPTVARDWLAAVALLREDGFLVSVEVVVVARPLPGAALPVLAEDD